MENNDSICNSNLGKYQNNIIYTDEKWGDEEIFVQRQIKELLL